MKEDYVSFEVAKLFEKNGFDERCYKKYNSSGDLCDSTDFTYGPKAPTLQMAMKWLREIHRLFIEISVNINLDDKYYYYSAVYDKDMNIKKNPVENKYGTYEEAAMDAINYCLTKLL